MIKGIGIDIIEIKRIERAIHKNENFLKRIFTVKEIEYFESIDYGVNSIAGSFAAKEAIMKVLGTGLREFKWTDIEIGRDHLGKPYSMLHNNAKRMADNCNIKEILISISHSKEYAVAQALGV